MCACTRCALHCAAAKRPRNVSGEGAKAVLYVGTDPRSFTVLTAGRHCVDCRVQCSRAGATAAARKMVGTSSPHATRTNATHKSPTVMRPPPRPPKNEHTFRRSATLLPVLALYQPAATPTKKPPHKRKGKCQPCSRLHNLPNQSRCERGWSVQGIGLMLTPPNSSAGNRAQQRMQA